MHFFKKMLRRCQKDVGEKLLSISRQISGWHTEIDMAPQPHHVLHDSCSVLGTTTAAADCLWLQREVRRRLISNGGSWQLQFPAASRSNLWWQIVASKKRESDAHFLPICDTLITTNGYWPRGRTTELDIGSPRHSADPSRSTRIDCEPTRFTVVHCNPPFFSGYCHHDWSFWVGNSLLKTIYKSVNFKNIFWASFAKIQRWKMQHLWKDAVKDGCIFIHVCCWVHLTLTVLRGPKQLD